MNQSPEAQSKQAPQPAEVGINYETEIHGGIGNEPQEIGEDLDSEELNRLAQDIAAEDQDNLFASEAPVANAAFTEMSKPSPPEDPFHSSEDEESHEAKRVKKKTITKKR